MNKYYRPLTHRAFQWIADKLCVPPVVTGIVCTLLLGGIALWLAWLIGTVADVAAGHLPDIAVRAPVTLYMMVGYLPMAVYYLGRWTTEHFETIADQFGLNRQAVLFPRRMTNLLGAIGVFAAYLLFLHRPDQPLVLFQPLRWTADFVFPLVGLVFMGWFNFRFMFLLVWTAVAISRTARHIHSIDLLDTNLVKPYAQHGVRSSLLAVVSLSISANLWLDPNSPTIGTVTTLVTLVGAAVLALILPTWGIHQRLKALKQSELKQIREAIVSRRDPRTRSVDDAQQLRADLALEQRLMDVSEWPFDAGSYGRVALYVFLGLGSWVGAALVERLLEALGT
ncbi:MAG: hypothetical protein ACR2QI_09715 [Woeseiaceae bacterium]